MAEPSSPHPAIEFAVLSDIGMRRANNQDAATAMRAESTERYQRRGHLFVVADGMGAHAAGELASRMAVEKIPLHYLKRNATEAVEALRESIQEANQEIFRRGQQNPEFHNMGTTASALVLLPEGALVAHVGDSRVYRLRRGVFEQLTFDHSLLWEMQAAGQVTPNSALSHAIPKNVITRSLGPSAEVEVDVEGPWPIEPGDRYLLCSDGLTGQVDDEEIGALLACLPPRQAVRVLVDLANLRGGPDNITIIAVEIHRGDGEAAPLSLRRSTPRFPGRPATPLVATTAACLLATLLMLLLGSYGPATVTAVLSLIALGFTLQNWYQAPSAARAGHSRGGGPYRRYPIKAGAPLIARLGGTLLALREASREKGWRLDWPPIDHLQGQAEQARREGKGFEAVRLQAEAIIETMRQLRDQHNRQAGDSTLDI